MLSFVSRYKIDCEIDRIILKTNAVQNESTWKPFTNFVQIRIIAALITSKNKPSVRMVTGKVKSTKIGFTIRFSNPSTTATTKDVFNPSSSTTPCIKCEMMMTRTAVMRILISMFMIFDFKNQMY